MNSPGGIFRRRSGDNLVDPQKRPGFFRLTPRIGWKAKVTLRLGPKDAHYSGGLVAGARILELFGDAATALCLRETRGRDEGLFRAYQSVDFLILLKNSLIVSFGAAGIAIILGISLAYAFARFRFPGRQVGNRAIDLRFEAGRE